MLYNKLCNIQKIMSNVKNVKPNEFAELDNL